MPETGGPDRPRQSPGRGRKLALRTVVGLVVVAIVGFRFFSYDQEWNHHKDQGYAVGAAFRDKLLENQLGAAYESTTASFKERWSREDLQDIAVRLSADDSTQSVGFSIHGGFWSKLLRGHLRTEYPIALEEGPKELRLTIVEDDGVLRVDRMEVVRTNQEE